MNVPQDPMLLRMSLPSRTRQGFRRRTFLLTVMLPTALVFLYLALFAMPQYATRFRYSVYSQSASGTSATNGNPALAPTSSAESRRSEFIVTDYVMSQQMVSDLSAKLRLAAMFKPAGYDFIFRFWWDNGSIERLWRYWRNWVVDAHFDAYSGLGSVEVRAFSPQDALRIGQTVLELSEAMLNELDRRARESMVAALQEEVDRGDKRLREAMRHIAEFRTSQRTFLPSHPADTTETLAAGLRQHLASMNAQYTSLTHALIPTAPAIVSLKSQITATEQQLDKVLNGLGDGPVAGQGVSPEAVEAARLPNQIGSFEYLDADRLFALTAREEALKQLEQARYNVRVQHYFVQAHTQPMLPKEAAYPLIIVWTLVTFLVLATCWMIATLLYFAMRDHTR